MGLAWLPYPTTLGPAAKPAPIAFGRGGNAPSHNSCQKIQQRKAPFGVAAKRAGLPPVPKPRQTSRLVSVALEVSKKTEKPIKPKKPKKQ